MCMCTTYRSASKDDLGQLSGRGAFQELVDNVLGDVDLHGLDGRVFGILETDVAIRGSDERNGARVKHGGSHGAISRDQAWRMDVERGVKLAPGCC